MYPTFEDIENPVQVCEFLQKLHYEKTKGKPVRERTVNPPKKTYAKQFSILFTAVLSLLVLYTLDFYLLPKMIVDDSVKKIQLKDNGVIYSTNRNLRFLATSSILGRQIGRKFKVKQSPIFNTVVDIYDNGKSWKANLTSSLHGMVKYFHFGAIVTLFISILILRNEKNQFKSELIMKATVFTLFAVFLLFYINYRIG